MTTISMHQALVPVAVRQLNNLAAILGKAQAHCETNKIDPAAFVQARIFPDMFPLAVQVRIACDITKGAVARLAGVENPKFEDTETTLAQLQERIAKTVAYLATFTADQIDGTEDKDIVVKTPSRELNFKGLAYLTGFVLPNVYFHSTTTYNLLRQGGVPLGKADFLGNI
jgi:hypothetical protein